MPAALSNAAKSPVILATEDCEERGKGSFHDARTTGKRLAGGSRLGTFSQNAASCRGKNKICVVYRWGMMQNGRVENDEH